MYLYGMVRYLQVLHGVSERDILGWGETGVGLLAGDGVPE
jgi:hypothetical protein